MSAKKELNEQDLQKVTGGWVECPDSFVGQHVELHYIVFGKIRSHGGTATHCTVDVRGRGCYYIEFEDSRFDGWYLPSTFDISFQSEEDILNSRTRVE